MQQTPFLQIDNRTVYYHNKEELLILKKEIFTQHCYYFETNTARPLIIDAGAHIGLSTLYFKKQLPLARVIAIEPNPTNFELLEKNIWDNKLANVNTIQVALDTHEGTTQLNIDRNQAWYSTSSLLENAWNGDLPSEPIEVKTMTLSGLLHEPVDLLKLDIEGSELAVLKEAEDKLNLVDQLFVEFHPHKGQTLTDLTNLLDKHQYRLSFSKDGGELTLHQAHNSALVLIHAQRR